MLTLPALRQLGGRGPRRFNLLQPNSEPEPIECAVQKCAPLELAMVERESRRWRELIERYHYWVSRALRWQSALLGEESRPGTGVFALDLAWRRGTMDIHKCL